MEQGVEVTHIEQVDLQQLQDLAYARNQCQLTFNEGK
jgi:hypothetical protein